MEKGCVISGQTNDKNVTMTVDCDSNKMDFQADWMLGDKQSVFDMELNYIGSLCVKSPSDVSDCGIEDCLLLSDYKMVLTDSYNKCVKLVDIINDKVISHCVLKSAPFALTLVNPNLLVTTHPSQKRIEFITVNNGQLAPSHDVKVNGMCGGISCKDDKLVVTYRAPVKVEVLDMEGNLLHTVCGPDKNQDMFGLPGCVVFSTEQNVLIISDYERNKVFKVDFEGHVLSSYEHHDLRNPSGLTVSRDGTILVCSEDTHGLHAISRDFKKNKVFLTCGKILHYPGIITYCGTNNKLYINNNIEDERGNNMLIFQFL